MSLRGAILELWDRLKVLRTRLEALTELTTGVGGGCVHHLVEQVDKSAVDALGWAKEATKAIRRAAKPRAGLGAIRRHLTDAQHALDRLRQKEPRRLRGRALGVDL